MPSFRIAFACLVASLIVAAPALALSGDDAATQLSRQREAQGLPSGITQNPVWSGFCGLHVGWELQNNVQSHPEAPGSPGYSEDGNWAGTHAVLGPQWDGNGDYMAHAPWHYLQVMHPRLSQIGYADNDRFSCMTTWPGFLRPGPASPTIYPVPADGRTTGWWESTANEYPYNPLETLGLPKDTLTGPTIYVYADGPWPSYQNAKATVASASLTGPNGPVQLLTVDDSTNSGKPPIMPRDSALLIPRFPLEPGASYTASVTLNLTARAPDTIVTDDSNGGDTVIPGTNYSGNYTKTWTFKTAAANPSTDLAFKQGGIVCKPKPGADADCHKATRKDLLDAGLLAEVGLGKGKRKGSKLAVPLTASKALVGKKATLNLKVLSFRGSKNLRASTLTLRPTQTLSLPAPPRGSVLVVTVQAGPAGVMKSFR